MRHPAQRFLARYAVPAVAVAAAVLATHLLGPSCDSQFLVAVRLSAGDPLPAAPSATGPLSSCEVAMNERPRARLVAYAVVVLATGSSVLLRSALWGFVVTKAPFLTFSPAIILGASLGGWRPGLVATPLGAAAADDFLLEPRDSFGIHGAADRYAVGRLVLTGVFIGGPGESPRRSHRRILAGERRHAVTLASLGDAVIATDHQARVTSLNPVAEREAAHQRSGMVAAFSGVAGGVASGLEDQAARGQLEESRPPAARLETMAEEWLRPVGGLSLDALREQAGVAGSPDRAAGP
jgi:hypothetical protein